MNAERGGQSSMGPAKWDFWVDRGDMFTDVIGRSPAGILHRRKLPLERLQTYPDAAIHGIRKILGVRSGDPIPAYAIRRVKMGAAVTTNTLLERRGERTALVVAKGFRDALRTACRARPGILAKAILKPERLYDRVIEIDAAERPDDLADLRGALETARADGFEAIAVVFTDCWNAQTQERSVAALAREIGFRRVSASHEVAPLVELAGRGDVGIVNAYLSPILRRDVEQISEALGVSIGTPDGPALRFMMSSGGMSKPDRDADYGAVLPWRDRQGRNAVPLRRAAGAGRSPKTG